MHKKFLLIYNTCEFKRKNTDWYLTCIDNFLYQDYDSDSFKILVSGCCNTEDTKIKILQRYGNKIWYHNTNESLAVQQTCNLSVKNCLKKSDIEFDEFIYIDSGMNYGNVKNVLSTINEYSKTEKYGMIDIQPDSDSGFNMSSPELATRGGDTHGKRCPAISYDVDVRAGYSLNTHFCSMNKKLRSFYENILPDIFIGCFDSIMTYLPLALNLKRVIVKDIQIQHAHSIDGPCSKVPGFSEFDVLPGVNIYERLINDTARSLGLGYTEWSGTANMPHNPTLYTEEGFPKNELLKYYIKDNLFTKPEIFNYDKISYELYM
jgi:hypothetical protein